MSKSQKGMNHGKHKLNDLQVFEIRFKYKPHEYSMGMLAKEYEVGRSTIQKIIERENWNHLK